jgi:glutathione S-transferase
MSKIQILGAPQSVFVRVVRIVAHEKSLDYDLLPMPPQTPDIRAVHPFGKIPVMRRGDFTLCESKAIATYFDRIGTGPRLIPDNAEDAAKVEQWVSLMNTCFDPGFSPYVGGYVFSGWPDAEPPREAIAAVLPRVEQSLSALNAGIGPAGVLVGSHFSLADAAVLPSLYYLRGLPESSATIAGLPALAAYIARHESRASVKATVPPPLTAEDIAAIRRILASAA